MTKENGELKLLNKWRTILGIIVGSITIISVVGGFIIGAITVNEKEAETIAMKIIKIELMKYKLETQGEHIKQLEAINKKLEDL